MKDKRIDKIMGEQKPYWPSAVVAITFVGAITTIFVVVYMRDGLDGAMKAWGAIGSLVGVVIGAIPSYFFHVAADQKQADLNKLMQAADMTTIQKARDLGFKG